MNQFKEHFFELMKIMIELSNHPRFSEWTHVMSIDENWTYVPECTEQWLYGDPSSIIDDDINRYTEYLIEEEIGWEFDCGNNDFNNYLEFSIKNNLPIDQISTRDSWLSSRMGISKEEFSQKWEGGYSIRIKSGEMSFFKDS